MEKLQYKTGLSTDEQIIQKILAGETALFEVLIRRYNPLLYKIARSNGLNHQDAEDLMQESHFTAYTMLKTFRNEASYKTWLTKIHLHKCYYKLNHGYLKYETSDNDLITDAAVVINNYSNKQDTEKMAINKELAHVLEASIQQLPLPYRQVFVLREMEGFSVTETADLLNITPVNVKVRLNRAKAMLQKQLEEFYSYTELFEFNLIYCDDIVKKIFQRIAQSTI